MKQILTYIVFIGLPFLGGSPGYSQDGNGTSHTITSNDLLFHNVIYTIPAVQSNTFIDQPQMVCGNGIVPVTINKFDQHSQHAISISECNELAERARDYSLKSLYHKAYDTMKYYIEQCYYQFDASMMFGQIGNNCAILVEKYLETSSSYRKWLQSVLYLSSDTNYYCRDVLEIARSYLFSNDSIGIDAEAVVGISKYLLDSSYCQREALRRNANYLIYNQARYWQRKVWQDTVKDSLATPLDTTKYKTLDELDLGAIRRSTSSVTESPSSVTRRLASVQVERNPFADEVGLNVELDASTMLRVDVYDELGRQMYAEALGFKPKGEHRFTIQSKGWSSGTYYIRLSTPSGEIKTLKVVKE